MSRASAWISRWSAVSWKSTAGDDTPGGGASGDRELAPDLAQLRFDLDEHLDDPRVELPTGLVDDLAAGRLPAHRPPIRPVARHRIERVGDGEDPCTDRDFVA